MYFGWLVVKLAVFSCEYFRIWTVILKLQNKLLRMEIFKYSVSRSALKHGYFITQRGVGNQYFGHVSGGSERGLGRVNGPTIYLETSDMVTLFIF